MTRNLARPITVRTGGRAGGGGLCGPSATVAATASMTSWCSTRQWVKKPVGLIDTQDLARLKIVVRQEKARS
jgi:hypothetical protein